ncbi:hypothetical protein KSP40_PGU004504 [Platanthera guangdongensis]|uniref:DCD domain-containing protein n=1 Tax=Platanthera guangdongensis TaxID=2320717 RepID=A0ABR2MYR1_9ASPA
MLLFLSISSPQSFRFTMEYGNGKRPINSSDGAIFMWNKFTKKECFRRKLFGLQSNHSDIVKLVKTGTILFLFEPEERKLNGVFRATSDGAMNIVPSAFSSSQKRFPAQVRFETLCSCRPLSENEFREAIEENYFSPTKFTFALSRQQVCKLIFLFSSRSSFSCDWFPGGIQREIMKTQESSNLARTRATGNEKLLKFDAAEYMENNNIHSTSNPISSDHGEDHLMNNHDLLDMRLQNQRVRRQYKPYPTVSRTLDSRKYDQMPSKSCYDIPISSVHEENHLKSYRNHVLHDITLQSHMVRRQHEPYPGVPHTLERRRPDQPLSKSCYDLPISCIHSENHLASYHNLELDDVGLPNHVARPQHESYPAICHTFEPQQPNEIVSKHHYGLSMESIPYSSSLRLMHEKPSPFLGTECPYLHKKAHDLCTDSSLDFESHSVTKSYTSTPHLGANYFSLTNYPGSDISKISPISEPSKPSPPSPEGHVNFPDFNRSASPGGSQPPLGRLQAINSPSLRLRNTRPYSRPTQQEGASSSILDYPSSSLVDYVPISEREILVDSSYNQMLKDEVVNEEAFKVFPVRNKFHYHPGFTTDTNFPGSDDFDFIYNNKIGVSDLMFPQSNVVQKRCSVFSRLSRSTKDFKYPRRNLVTKMNRKSENLEILENDAQQLDNIGENGPFEKDYSTEIVVEESKESSGSVFRNFKRRSMVKQESTVASDLGKCKKRKIVRPSFTEGDDSSLVKNNNRQNHLFQPDESPGNIKNLGPPISSLQHEKGRSTTNSSVIDIQGSQQTLHHPSKVSEKFPVDLVAQESRNSYSVVILDDNVEGKQENLRDLPLHSPALLEEKHKVSHESENSSSGVIHHDNTDKKEESSFDLRSHSSALLEAKHSAIHESENSYSIVIHDASIDGKEENSHDLPLPSSSSLEEMHEATYETENSHGFVSSVNNVGGKSVESSQDLTSRSSALLGSSNNSTAVFSTSNTFISNRLPEKDSSTNIDMNCITIVKIGSLGFPLSI